MNTMTSISTEQSTVIGNMSMLLAFGCLIVWATSIIVVPRVSGVRVILAAITVLAFAAVLYGSGFETTTFVISLFAATAALLVIGKPKRMNHIEAGMVGEGVADYIVEPLRLVRDENEF